MYTVRSGDTVTAIAKRHNVRPEAILRANASIRHPDKLVVGQKIIIPPATERFRPPGSAQGRQGDILATLRQGSAMFATAFYAAYEQAKSFACATLGCRSFDRKRFYEAYRAEFKGVVLKQKHIDGLNQLIGFIERDPDMTNVKVAAYLLATIHHETYWPATGDRYLPITEGGGQAGKAYFNKYDPVLSSDPELKARAKRHGNVSEGDGYKYRGRGYVQVTWKDNYKKCGDHFGRDLVSNPDLALEPQLSYDIASWGMREGIFTKRTVGEFINGSKADYVGARQVINGTDKDTTIADYARKFERILFSSIEN